VVSTWTGWLIVLTQLLGVPALQGLATYYEYDSGVMRNGEQLDLAGRTCAVDDSEWAKLQDHLLLIVAWGPEGPLGSVRAGLFRVTDTGLLYDAGQFAPDQHDAHGWPIRWAKAERGEQIALDLPRDAFRLLSPLGHTIQVAAWDLGKTGVAHPSPRETTPLDGAGVRCGEPGSSPGGER